MNAAPLLEDKPLLTKVVLEGAMGEKFGREWELAITTPIHALKVINANRPGLFAWIRDNLEIYTHYQVVVEYLDGRMEEVNEHEIVMMGEIKSVRYVPHVQGSGNAVKMIVGAVLLVISYFVPPLAPYLVPMGIGLMVGGIVGMLTKAPQVDALGQVERKDKTSYFFDGAVNTTGQGQPVALVYGRLIVGSHTIHASQSVEQLM